MSNKVSIIIPLYNKANYIKRAICSILDQSVQDFEIIVVDDGSTDNGPQIVKMIKDSRIQLIQQINKGVSAARNRGIQEAKTDLIAFLDADDAWNSNFLETVLRLRKKYPNAGLYATAYETKKMNGWIVKPKYKAIPPSPWEGIIPNYFESVLGGQPPVWSSATMVPKPVFARLGGFMVGEKLGEDLDMWLRIALEYPVAFSNIVASRYHCDAEGQTMQREKAFEVSEIERTIQNVLLSRKMSSNDRVFLKEIINGRKLVRASYYIKAGLFEQARSILRDCPTRLLWKRKLWYYFLLVFPPTIVLSIHRFFSYGSGKKI